MASCRSHGSHDSTSESGYPGAQSAGHPRSSGQPTLPSGREHDLPRPLSGTHLTFGELKTHVACLSTLARGGHGTRTVDDLLSWLQAELEARGPGLGSEGGSAPTSSSAFSQEGADDGPRPGAALHHGPAPAQLFAKATHSSHLNYSDILQAFAATASGGGRRAIRSWIAAARETLGCARSPWTESCVCNLGHVCRDAFLDQWSDRGPTPSTSCRALKHVFAGLDPESLADYLHNLAVLCNEAPDNELVVRPSVHSADLHASSGRFDLHATSGRYDLHAGSGRYDLYAGSGRGTPTQARGPALPGRTHVHPAGGVPLPPQQSQQQPGTSYHPRHPGQAFPPRHPAHASLMDDGSRGAVGQPLRTSSDPLRLLSALEELDLGGAGRGGLALGGGLRLGALSWEEAPPGPHPAHQMFATGGQGLLKTSSAPEHVLQGALGAENHGERGGGIGGSPCCRGRRRDVCV